MAVERKLKKCLVSGVVHPCTLPTETRREKDTKKVQKDTKPHKNTQSYCDWLPLGRRHLAHPEAHSEANPSPPPAKQLSAPVVIPPSSREPLIPIPDRFSSELDQCEPFLLTLWPCINATDRAKIAFAIS